MSACIFGGSRKHISVSGLILDVLLTCAGSLCIQMSFYHSQVHFALEPQFLSHIVGTEDRIAGGHYVIREFKMFEERIVALEHRLSPFLEASHRNKVLAHRDVEELT